MTLDRRSVLKAAGGAALVAQSVPGLAQTRADDRSYWLSLAARLADPVLIHLARGTLKQAMPVEVSGQNEADRRKFSHLEAFARLLVGIAPWLEVDLPPGPEQESQQHYRELARQALTVATDPASLDFLNFGGGGQALVDCGFLGEALLRAPNELWRKLPAVVQNRVAEALEASRGIVPPYNNWLLFSATVEAALAMMGRKWDGVRIDYALRKHSEWYLGDGVYGDGPQFHWDYYNSYVIQPMLLDVLGAVGKNRPAWNDMLPAAWARAKRYAVIQERLIAVDGSFPAIGRSIAYRSGAFHLLAAVALAQQLPPPLKPAQVRSALTAVLRRIFEAPGTFDSNGWLQIGLCGHQPHLGESYISTGSLYLCSAALLPLGLPGSDPFWADPPADWTAKRIWAGQDSAADHAL